MRKIIGVAVIATALVGLTAVQASAAEGSELEISGNVTTISGWQGTRKTTAGGPAIKSGVLNDGLIAPDTVLNRSDFGFFVDQVELDLAKGFGENIRLRADLDFSPHRAPAAGGVYVEQGYVTANIPAGNGVELLLGRFNSGIGLDPTDRHLLSTVTFSSIRRSLLPDQLTGLRLGYDTNEATRVEVYLVNSLADGAIGAANSNLPSLGLNVSYAWGDEGNKNWVKFNAAAGPEQATNQNWTFLGDLNGNVAVSDAFCVGAEGTYRQTALAGGVARKNIGGQLKGTYAFSDVWDGTLRYSLVWDVNGGGVVSPNPITTAFAATEGLGSRAVLHSLSLATGYQITDGAKFILEGAVDVSKASAAGSTTGLTPGVAGLFAYNF